MDEYRVSLIENPSGRVVDTRRAEHARAASERVFELLPLAGVGDVVVVETLGEAD